MVSFWAVLETDTPVLKYLLIPRPQAVLEFLKEHVSSTITKEVIAVGHRVVHGLEINEPRELKDDVGVRSSRGRVGECRADGGCVRMKECGSWGAPSGARG